MVGEHRRCDVQFNSFYHFSPDCLFVFIIIFVRSLNSHDCDLPKQYKAEQNRLLGIRSLRAVNVECNDKL